MSEDLDSLELEVDKLNDGNSLFRFNAAFKRIENAVADTGDADLPRLRSILSTFGNKVPDGPTHKRLERDVEDLSDILMKDSLAVRIARIAARNQALEDLTSGLETQISKANKDANLLTQIKDGIDKATATVNQAKTLIDQLTDTDASTKDKLKALIDALAGASTILQPA
jgi:uncharacterized phage infection (PIP) family protein YhgE